MYDPKVGSVVFHSVYAEEGVEASTPAARHRLGPMHGVRLTEPYPIKGPVERKRALAQSFGTTFCYDFPDMFREALRRIWARFTEQVPYSRSAMSLHTLTILLHNSSSTVLVLCTVLSALYSHLQVVFHPSE